MTFLTPNQTQKKSNSTWKKYSINKWHKLKLSIIQITEDKSENFSLWCTQSKQNNFALKLFMSNSNFCLSIIYNRHSPHLFEVGVDWFDLGFPHSGHFEYSRLLFTLSRPFLFVFLFIPAHRYILCLEKQKYQHEKQ